MDATHYQEAYCCFSSRQLQQLCVEHSSQYAKRFPDERKSQQNKPDLVSRWANINQESVKTSHIVHRKRDKHTLYTFHSQAVPRSVEFDISSPAAAAPTAHSYDNQSLCALQLLPGSVNRLVALMLCTLHVVHHICSHGESSGSAQSSLSGWQSLCYKAYYMLYST